MHESFALKKNHYLYEYVSINSYNPRSIANSIGEFAPKFWLF